LKRRATSTTDPLVTGDPTGVAKADVSYDGLGRVTAITGADPVKIAWGLGASMTRLEQGGDDTATITMQDFGGTTVLHCHILDHEDNGMMAVIKVQ